MLTQKKPPKVYSVLPEQLAVLGPTEKALIKLNELEQRIVALEARLERLIARRKLALRSDNGR
jgi:uncharacterized small protein (DUF1192 family)